MNNDLKFVLITRKNLEVACKIQNEIFQEEDARQNYIEQIEKNPYKKEMEYFIVYLSNTPIGITGIYSYHEYPNDAWLGWFGILKKYRYKGYGGIVLDKTIQLARDKMYKNFRLYTDEYAKDAHRLYKSRGMLEEEYNNKDDKDEYLDWKIYIYSLNLEGEKVSYWSNKILGLKEQSKKEHIKILKNYNKVEM